MKSKIITLLLVACGMFSSHAQASNETPNNLTQYIDQCIGTGGHGHVFLGANVPALHQVIHNVRRHYAWRNIGTANGQQAFKVGNKSER